MRDYLIDLKNNTIKAMNNYKKEADSEMLHEKLDLVISRVKTLNPDIVNDELITKFMTVSKLKEELLKEGK